MIHRSQRWGSSHATPTSTLLSLPRLRHRYQRYLHVHCNEHRQSEFDKRYIYIYTHKSWQITIIPKPELRAFGGYSLPFHQHSWWPPGGLFAIASIICQTVYPFLGICWESSKIGGGYMIYLLLLISLWMLYYVGNCPPQNRSHSPKEELGRSRFIQPTCWIIYNWNPAQGGAGPRDTGTLLVESNEFLTTLKCVKTKKKHRFWGSQGMWEWLATSTWFPKKKTKKESLVWIQVDLRLLLHFWYWEKISLEKKGTKKQKTSKPSHHSIPRSRRGSPFRSVASDQKKKATTRTKGGRIKSIKSHETQSRPGV